MIRVVAPARLHFGLLNPAGAEPWHNIDGEPALSARRFGGVGLMIEEPALVLRAEPAREWSAHGPMAERALEAARRFVAIHRDVAPMALHVERAPPAHAGFGSGTQLGLAVAKALALADGRFDYPATDLARLVGRGERSAIGVHGFDGGGFIVEPGKLADEALAPLLIREQFPEAWRVVVICPPSAPGIHGAAERASFDRLRGERAAPEVMSRLVLLGMLPALRAGDCRAFGEVLFDFNARAGEAFASEQGGRYAGPLGAAIVAFLRGLGVAGVGQSSWGPTLFAVVEDEDVARAVRARVMEKFGDGTRIWVTKPSRGADFVRRRFAEA